MENLESKSNKNITIFILSVCFSAINILLYCLFFDVATWLFVCLIVVSALIVVLSFVLFFLNKTSMLRTLFIATILILFFSLLYQILVWLGYKDIISNPDAMKNLIQSTGGWGIAVFFAIQCLQVVILPIPGAITTIAGALIFGPTVAMFVSITAVLFGSFVAFFIGRYLGEKVVSWIVGKETCEKYSKLLYEKGKYLFFLMMLFPFFPDDILCMIVGMTTMSLKFFTITMLITRPLGLIPTCYFGSGTIIPYSGWGLIVWGVLILVMITLIILSLKYQPKIEEFVSKLSDKMSKKSNKNLQLNQDKNSDENKKDIP